jgi:hypothetical protein
MQKLKEIKKDKLIIFDLDDTLIQSEGKIKVIEKETKKIIKELTPSEFNYYQGIDPKYYLDFDDFNCPNILRRSKFIDKIFNKFKKYYFSGIPVSIVTARISSSLVRDFMLYNNIDVHPDLVIAIHDPMYNYQGTTAERKQKAIMNLIDDGFTDLIFFDDNHENLQLAKEIEGYKNSKIKLIKVD